MEVESPQTLWGGSVVGSLLSLHKPFLRHQVFKPVAPCPSSHSPYHHPTVCL